MSGVLHHFALTAKTRTGFSAGIVVWAIVAAISIAATIIFLLIAGFFAIAQRCDTVIAGLALGGLCVPKIRFCNIGDEGHRELGVT